MTTREEAANSLETFAREGRLIQNDWHGEDENGRKIACALGALDPSIDSFDRCPASLMPRWLALVTVHLFDLLPDEKLAECALAYAKSMRRWDALGELAWARAHREVLAKAIEMSFMHVREVADQNSEYWKAATKACGDVVDGLRDGSESLYLESDAAGHARELAGNAAHEEARKRIGRSSEPSFAELAADAAVGTAEAAYEAAATIDTDYADGAETALAAATKSVFHAAWATGVRQGEARREAMGRAHAQEALACEQMWVSVLMAIEEQL